MNRHLLAGLLLGSAGFLAACVAPYPAPAPAPGGQASAPASAPASLLRVTGTVSYLQRIALGPDAEVIVQLLDVSRMDAPSMVLAEQRFTAQQQVPLAFEMTVDAGRIDPRMRYSVSARILRGGKLMFISDTAYPVLTQGNPHRVEMVLRMVAQQP